jgi:hypothetical protein
LWEELEGEGEEGYPEPNDRRRRRRLAATSAHTASAAAAAARGSRVDRVASGGRHLLLDTYGQSLRHVNTLYDEAFGAQQRKVACALTLTLTCGSSFILVNPDPVDFQWKRLCGIGRSRALLARSLHLGGSSTPQ